MLTKERILVGGLLLVTGIFGFVKLHSVFEQREARAVEQTKPFVWITAEGELREPDGKAVVTVHRDPIGPDPLVVHLAVMGSIKGMEARLGQMTIPAGEESQSASITVHDDPEAKVDGFVQLTVIPDPSSIWEVPHRCDYRFAAESRVVTIRCIDKDVEKEQRSK